MLNCKDKEVLVSGSVIRVSRYATLNICFICACQKKHLCKISQMHQREEERMLLCSHICGFSVESGSLTNKQWKKNLFPTSKTGWNRLRPHNKCHFLTTLITQHSNPAIFPETFFSPWDNHATHWGNSFIEATTSRRQSCPLSPPSCPGHKHRCKSAGVTAHHPHCYSPWQQNSKPLSILNDAWFSITLPHPPTHSPEKVMASEDAVMKGAGLNDVCACE